MNMKKWTTPMAIEENYAGNAAVAESACYRQYEMTRSKQKSNSP